MLKKAGKVDSLAIEKSKNWNSFKFIEKFLGWKNVIKIMKGGMCE